MASKAELIPQHLLERIKLLEGGEDALNDKFMAISKVLDKHSIAHDNLAKEVKEIKKEVKDTKKDVRDIKALLNRVVEHLGMKQ